EKRDELAPFHQQFFPCFEAEDSIAGDLLHCGISKEPSSAVGQKRPTRSKPHHGACPLRSKSDRRKSNRDPPVRALGTLPLEPSQAVRQEREIEARSASSCCDRPVRLRAARNMPPVISTIVMLRLFARRQRASMSAYFTNSLTALSRFGLLASLRGGALSRSGTAWLGRSQKDGLPSRRGRHGFLIGGSRPSTRAQGRAAPSLPLQIGEMDAKTRDLALLAALRRRRLD